MTNNDPLTINSDTNQIDPIIINYNNEQKENSANIEISNDKEPKDTSTDHKNSSSLSSCNDNELREMPINETKAHSLSLITKQENKKTLFPSNPI